MTHAPQDWIRSLGDTGLQISAVTVGGSPLGSMPQDYRATADALSRLTPSQYRVTQDDGTEPPFRNAY